MSQQPLRELGCLGVGVDIAAFAAHIDGLQREQPAIPDAQAFDVRTGVLDGLVDGAILSQVSDQILRDVPRIDTGQRLAVKLHLDRFRHLEPTGRVRESQCSHRVVADARCECTQRSVDRCVRVASRDDHARRDQTGFHDHVMDASATAVEKIADLVARSELTHRRKGFRRLTGCGCEIVIEGENDLRRVGHRRPVHLVLEHLHDEVCAQVVHDHEIDAAHDHVVGLYRGLAALLGKNLLDHIHRISTVPRPCRQVSP